MSTEGHTNHIWIPDLQIRPGVPMDHISLIAQYIIEKKPDVIGQIGDWSDVHSLNGHAEKGSLELEGSRYADDIASFDHSFALLNDPIQAVIDRMDRNHKKKWRPRRVFCKGNHEHRANRAISNDPKWFGLLSSDDFKTPGWERHEFLKVVTIDGVDFSHFFKMQNSNNPIGGSTDNRLNKIGNSHFGGHTPGFLYGNRVYPDGKTRHSVTAGSAYLHTEDYRGLQCNTHFRGIVALNDVRDGNFDVMPVSLKFLCRKYEGMELERYMKLKYVHGDWAHLA